MVRGVSEISKNALRTVGFSAFLVLGVLVFFGGVEGGGECDMTEGLEVITSGPFCISMIFPQAPQH